MIILLKLYHLKYPEENRRFLEEKRRFLEEIGGFWRENGGFWREMEETLSFMTINHYNL